MLLGPVSIENKNMCIHSKASTHLPGSAAPRASTQATTATRNPSNMCLCGQTENPLGTQPTLRAHISKKETIFRVQEQYKITGVTIIISTE
jgi:hypothetical protein